MPNEDNVTEDFTNTELVFIYEALTSYLGNSEEVRCNGLNGEQDVKITELMEKVKAKGSG